MKKFALCALLAISLVLVSTPSTTYATTVRSVSEEELATLADVIVTGTVIRNEASWRAYHIYSQADVMVHTVIKSMKGLLSGAELSVLTLGGIVGDIGQRVEGSAQLQVGHTYQLYLVRHTDGFFYPVAMAQGVSETIVQPIGDNEGPVEGLK